VHDLRPAGWQGEKGNSGNRMIRIPSYRAHPEDCQQSEYLELAATPYPIDYLPAQVLQNINQDIGHRKPIAKCAPSCFSKFRRPYTEWKNIPIRGIEPRATAVRTETLRGDNVSRYTMSDWHLRAYVLDTARRLAEG